MADAVVVLTVETGGSGTFVHIVVVVEQDNQPIQIAQRFFGDRTQITSLNVVDGELLVQYEELLTDTQINSTYLLVDDELQPKND